MGDLLVYLALNLFERRKSFVYLPRQVRLDIRAFWSNYRAAEAEARRLLFSAGDVETIRFACLETEARQVGYMDGNSALYLHSSLIQQLPPVLRVYLGCATRLYPPVSG
jgi:DNA phosphorothioation-associated putative methyltransferase